MDRLPLSRLDNGFLVRSPDAWWFWPIATPPLVATSLDEVAPIFDQVEEHVRAGGWAGGAVSFQAAPAFDSAFHLFGERQASWLACFYLFDSPPEVFSVLASPPLSARTPRFEPSIGFDRYEMMFERVHNALQNGDTYQVNATFPLHTEASYDAAGLFSLLVGETPPPYAAFFPGPEGPILSLSPELFFEKRGSHIISRPMKGTRPRSGDPEELLNHPKDRAENLMIVDMIRNDLGRIAKTGSVSVPDLFQIEDHGTVWQMTSTVAAESDASVRQVFDALFPCASVVGAPKVETTRIIAETESWSRGLYTGAIGFIGPDYARFSVAIRTIETIGSQATYGIGSGIVWDSDAKSEWAECLAKAEVLRPYGEELRLLETLRWDPKTGFIFLEEHLARLEKTAHALGFPIDLSEVQDRLMSQPWESPQRVRLLVGTEVAIESVPIQFPFESAPPQETSLKIAISDVQVDSENLWLQHKTTLRRLYENALRRTTADDVILTNEKSHLTEFTIGNLVIRHGEQYFTPPLNAGLLPGIFRNQLLMNGFIAEFPITFELLQTADEIFRINSVRGWQKAELLTFPS